MTNALDAADPWLLALASACATSGSAASMARILASLDELAAERHGVAYYQLDHSIAGLRRVKSTVRSPKFPATVPFPNGTDVRHITERALQELVSPCEASFVPVTTIYGLVGAVALLSLSDTVDRIFLDCLVAGLVPIAGQEFISSLLTGMQQPISYRVDRDEFYRNMMTLIYLSTPMEYVAIRMKDDSELRCVAIEGFDADSESLEEFDIREVTDTAALGPFVGLAQR